MTLVPIDTIERTWSAVSDPAGLVLFPRVQPGRCRLSIGPASHPVASASIEVRPGEALVVDADLHARPASIRVTAREPTGYRTLFEAAALGALPSSPDVWSLVDAAAPVTFSDRLDSGGVASGEPARLGSHASSWTQTTVRDGTIDVTDPLLGGTPLLYPAIDALGAVTITTAAAPVGVLTPGPVVTLMPVLPGTRWHATATAALAPSRSPGRALPPPIDTLTSWNRAGIVAGGPLGARAGLTIAASRLRSTHSERDEQAGLPGNVDSLSAGAILTPAAAQRVGLHAGLQRTRTAFEDRARLRDRSAASRKRFVQARVEWDGGNSAPWWIDAGVASMRDNVASSSDVNGSIERLRDGPVPSLTWHAPGSRDRWTLRAGAAPRAARDHRHDLRAGVEVSGSRAALTPFGIGPIGERVDGIPARAWLYTGQGWSAATTGVAAYASDRYEPAARLTIDAGARLDVLHGAAAPASLTWTTISPRVRARWTAAARMSAFGAYSRYQDALPLVDLAFGAGAAPQADVYRWTDPDGDGFVQPAELGVLIARAGPGSAGGRSSIDPRLARPYVDEFVAGVDLRLAGAWDVRFAGISRRERRLLAVTDSAAAYDVRFVPDPGLDLGSPVDDQQLPIYARAPRTFGQDRYELTNPRGLEAGFDGFELTVDGAIGRRLRMRAGGTATRSHGSAASRGFLASENDQGLPGELFVDPNAATYADGRLFFERGYSAKWSASYAGPRGLRAAAVARYQDGQNFARLVIVGDLPQGPEAIRAYPNGDSRFTYTLTVDARLAQAWRIGRVRVTALLDVNNLLDTANEVEEDVVSGPAFRTPTARQPPRVVRAGLRIAY